MSNAIDSVRDARVVITRGPQYVGYKVACADDAVVADFSDFEDAERYVLNHYKGKFLNVLENKEAHTKVWFYA
jgi:hypothetical protein